MSDSFSFNRLLTGPGQLAAWIRWATGILVFTAIYFSAPQLVPGQRIYVLGTGCALVLLVGTWWWLEESHRLRITRQFTDARPDDGPDLLWFALFVVVQLIALFSLLFWTVQEKFHLYVATTAQGAPLLAAGVPSADGAPWYSWVLFTLDLLPLDSFHTAVSWIGQQLGVPLVQIDPPSAGAARYLDFAKQTIINVLLVAGIWRWINIRVDTSQAIRALTHWPDPSIRVGRRASARLAAVLHDERDEEGRRMNATKALGALARRGDRLSVVALCYVLDVSTDWTLRKSAAEALKKIGDPAASGSLCNNLKKVAEKQKQHELCAAIVEALKAVHKHSDKAQSSDARVASTINALRSFLRLRKRTGVKARRCAAELLGELQAQPADEDHAIAGLIDSVRHDRDAEVRGNALESLRILCTRGEWRDAFRRAFRAIQHSMKDLDDELQQRAKECIDAIRNEYRLVRNDPRLVVSRKGREKNEPPPVDTLLRSLSTFGESVARDSAGAARVQTELASRIADALENKAVFDGQLKPEARTFTEELRRRCAK